MRAYLDIETSFRGDVTVVGIYRSDGKLIQLVGEEVTSTSVLNALGGAYKVLTYNGSRFDLPVLKARAGVDLKVHFECHDLMYDCWRHNLYGGLKRVEEVLEIGRQTQGVTGTQAMRLWESYRMYGDTAALRRLLEYNRDDVVNLPLLEERLGLMDAAGRDKPLTPT